MGSVADRKGRVSSSTQAQAHSQWKAKEPVEVQSSADGPEERLSMAEERLSRWLDDMERLRLSEYLRYVQDRRRLFWSSFCSGIARGLGMAVGFTILGAILILILQDLARHNLPLVGELLDKMMQVVQNGMK